MGMRGPWANTLPYQLSRLRSAPKPRSNHRYRCRECRLSFTSVRDDARFCSDACRQRNCRRRNVAVPGRVAGVSQP